jgi:hypothetical protein
MPTPFAVRVLLALAFGALGGSFGGSGLNSATAQERKPEWPSSEFHGKIDGNGNPIPCRCLFQGQSYRLGESVCMNTYKGRMMAECDLAQNNTSWVPTDKPCTISRHNEGRSQSAAVRPLQLLPASHPLGATSINP